MSVETSSTRLAHALKSFRQVWQESRAEWRDQKASSFEEKYVVLAEACVRTALTAMDEMNGTLAGARRDCR